MSSPKSRAPAKQAIAVELVMACVVAGLSAVAAPPSGVVMHWGADGVAGWSMSPAGYAVVAGVATLLLGHFITLLVAHKWGLAFTWLAPLATGVFWVAYGALQRVWLGIESFGAAAVFAVLCYFLLLWLVSVYPDRGSVRRSGSTPRH
ncbi:hypothetical protein ACXR2T_12310 [Leucobacter sp. HY1910]